MFPNVTKLLPVWVQLATSTEKHSGHNPFLTKMDSKRNMLCNFWSHF